MLCMYDRPPRRDSGNVPLAPSDSTLGLAVDLESPGLLGIHDVSLTSRGALGRFHTNAGAQGETPRRAPSGLGHTMDPEPREGISSRTLGPAANHFSPRTPPRPECLTQGHISGTFLSEELQRYSKR